MDARRAQANEILGMSNSTGYDNPSQPNQESSAKPPSPAPIASSTLPVSTINQTLDQHESAQDLDPVPGAPHERTVPLQPITAHPTVASASSIRTAVRYRECLKNHAASTGGHVIDGCGEFMPNGEEGTPEALKCAACDCHRNFHRREADSDQLRTGTSSHFATAYQPPSKANSIFHPSSAIHHAQPLPLPTQAAAQQQPKYGHGYTTHHVASPSSRGPVMMAFGGNNGAPAESSRSSEDLNNMFHPNNNAAGTLTAMQQMYSSSRKRFRTKFTEQQKERMHEFAERLEWRIQKQDEQQVQQFCDELGVKRQVFKVWMHNNKQAMKKKIM